MSLLLPAPPGTYNAQDQAQMRSVLQQADAQNIKSNQGIAGSSPLTPRTLFARFSEFSNVRDFGAVGDGVIDDTVSIQAAIDALATGQALFFPPGSYMSTGVLFSGSSVNKTGLTFVGYGAKLILIGGVANKNAAEITTGADYVVWGLKFVGNKGTVTTPGTDASFRYYNGLYVGATAGKTLTRVRVYDCDFISNAYAGMMIGSGPVDPGNILPGASDVSVSGCQFVANEDGIAGGVQTRTSIIGNKFYQNTVYGMLVDTGSADCLIQGNTIDSTGGTYGIFNYNAAKSSILGNTIKAGDQGILLTTGCAGSAVQGNTIDTPTAHGVTVFNSSKCSVVGNTVTSPGQYGVQINTAFDCAVGQNVVSAAAYDGIYLDGVSATAVNGNASSECVGSGINALGCSTLAIVGNVLRDNSHAGGTAGQGIRLNNTIQCAVNGNRAFDSRGGGSKTQNYGLTEEGSSDQNTIVGNQFDGNKTGEEIILGANSMVLSRANALFRLPTSAAGLAAGTLWNNTGVVNVA